MLFRHDSNYDNFEQYHPLPCIDRAYIEVEGKSPHVLYYGGSPKGGSEGDMLRAFFHIGARILS